MSAELVVLGLGTMGGRAAAVAVEAGLSVVGYDPIPVARAMSEAQGVVTVSDAAEAVQQGQIILLSVPRPEHVTALAEGALQTAAPGSIVVDLSTIDPETARGVARTLAEKGVTYLDAPVLGRPEKCGNWTLVVGGPTSQIGAVQPLLERTVAAAVVRVGDVGAGSVVKLVNNLMFGAINAITAEALMLCRNNGVNPATFVETVADSGAATVSNLFKELAPRMVAGDDDPTFALELLAKDNRLAVELADRSNTVAPLAQAVDAVNKLALDLGLGARDSGAIMQAYSQMTPNAATPS